jgi:hypothetical protein
VDGMALVRSTICSGLKRTKNRHNRMSDRSPITNGTLDVVVL